MTGRLKKLMLLTTLLTGLTLLGGGCSSLKPSASVPEWEQARAEHPAPVTPAQDLVWQVFALLGETLADTN